MLNELELAQIVDELYRAIPSDRVHDIDTVMWHVHGDVTDHEIAIMQAEMTRRYPPEVQITVTREPMPNSRPGAVHRRGDLI